MVEFAPLAFRCLAEDGEDPLRSKVSTERNEELESEQHAGSTRYWTLHPPDLSTFPPCWLSQQPHQVTFSWLPVIYNEDTQTHQ